MSVSKVVSVIPTFFSNNGCIDHELVHAHIQNQIENGIKSIAILTIFGEATSLSLHERLVFAHHIYIKFNEKINITVGINGNNTEELVEEITKMDKISHNIMITQPVYNNPTQEGIFQHFKKLIDSTTKPIIIGNIPNTFNNIDAETMQKIVNYSNRVIGFSGNLFQMLKTKNLCPNILFWSNDDYLAVPFFSGGHGVMSQMTNVIPRMIQIILFACESNNVIAAYESFYSVFNLFELLCFDVNPVFVKYFLSLMNNTTGPNTNYENVKLPLVKLTYEQKKPFDTYLNTMNKFIDSVKDT